MRSLKVYQDSSIAIAGAEVEVGVEVGVEGEVGAGWDPTGLFERSSPRSAMKHRQEHYRHGHGHAHV